MINPTVLPTERIFSPQTVCVWASGVYCARALRPTVPGTKDEVIALAADSGVTDWYNVGRANFTKLAVGMLKRYGLKALAVVEGAAAAQTAVLAAAGAGAHVIGLAGNQLNLTPHWQSGSVGHAIAVLYPSGTTGTQLDPLAPAGYAGDSFSPTELAQFTTAAIIFKEAATMPGFKAKGPKLGSFKFSGTHALISPLDPKVHYMQVVDAVFYVYGALDLKKADGTAVDIDGNSPPLNARDQVYLVDSTGFGVAAYALRAEGVFTAAPDGYTEKDLADAKRVAANVVSVAAATAASKF